MGYDAVVALEEKYIPVPESGCWLWIGADTGTKNPCGRVRDFRGTGYITAHKLLYELTYGGTPKGYAVTHQCGINCCVNPTHLSIRPWGVGIPQKEAFDAKWEEAKGGCWMWKACHTADGYGHFRVGEKMVGAHRVAYELYRTPIPDGLVTDHLCRVRDCVNPWHMELVTPEENVRRGVAGSLAGARMRAKTHCPHGHGYTPENTYIDGRGGRRCRACAKIRNEARRAKCIAAAVQEKG